MSSVCFPILRMRCLQVSSLTFCTKQLLLIKTVKNVVMILQWFVILTKSAFEIKNNRY